VVVAQIFALVVAAGFVWMTWRLIADRDAWSKPVALITLIIGMLGICTFLLWVSLGLFDQIRFYSVPLGLIGMAVGALGLAGHGWLDRR
ncbi:MAG: hypothetical protein KDJ36_13650, partial [Hyphomicrobiaceae bacterium]|nr:hypothetical protein [Hyphomicrobiaceae bacterium]